MTIQTRPDNQVFASGANPGEVALFPDILRGWGITLEQTEGKPPMEWMNGVMQRFDRNIQYTLQRGIPEWHSETDYPAHAVVQHDGLFYVSAKNNTGTTPGTDAEKWSVFWDGIPRLKMYKTLPATNEGDVHLIGSGAYAWRAEKNTYIPINSPAKRVGMLETFSSRQHLQKEGGTPRDGQLVLRALYPDFVREYLDNGVLPCAQNDAAWLADTSLRTQWVSNDGKGNFRVPDWNGKQSGSVAVYGGRGDGAKSNGVHGKIQFDAIRNIKGASTTMGNLASGALKITKTWAAVQGGNAVHGSDYDFDASLVVPTVDPVTGDNRVTAPTVVWGVYLSNSTDTTLSPAKIDVLLGQSNALIADVQSLQLRLSDIDEITVYPNGGNQGAPANITVNSVYEFDNPYHPHRVECVVKVFVAGRWGVPNIIYSADGYGASAEQVETVSGFTGKIELATGKARLVSGIRSDACVVFSPPPSAGTNTAPCKVIVRKIK